MPEKRRGLIMDRRESLESRLDVLEFRIAQVDTALKKISDEREEILYILKNIEVAQAQTKTIIGGAAFLASGAIAAAWWFIQSVFVKVFHD